MIVRFFLFATFSIHAATLALGATTCQKNVGMFGGPIVNSSKTALSIYLAIARERGDIVVKSQIEVTDRGEAWSVFQAIPGFVGGGRLEMRIKKCDATVQAHYSK